jgi:hypothetical protein
MTSDFSGLAHPFVMVSVKPSEAPPGAEGLPWHCYVITQGENKIEGRRQGTLQAVTSAVEELVERLNQRRMGGPRRVQLALSSNRPDREHH